MFNVHPRLRYALVIVTALVALQAWMAPTALAADDDDAASTFVRVTPPRNSPAPIPHSDVLAPEIIPNFLESEGITQSHARAAGAAADAQGIEGEPGVLKTETEIASGLTLYDVSTACADFGRTSRWSGQIWTMQYGNWGNFAADDGYFQAKNVTFDRELSVGPGNNYNRSREASLKIASNQPYDAGVMSPPLPTDPGDVVRVRVNYLIYNHGQEADSLDYASMAVIPKLGERGQYVFGYHRGEWATLEQEVVAEGDEIVIMLQGHSPAALNSNIYFDNVEVYVDSRRVRNCWE